MRLSKEGNHKDYAINTRVNDTASRIEKGIERLRLTICNSDTLMTIKEDFSQTISKKKLISEELKERTSNLQLKYSEAQIEIDQLKELIENLKAEHNVLKNKHDEESNSIILRLFQSRDR